jgi:hypothetical protein
VALSKREEKTRKQSVVMIIVHARSFIASRQLPLSVISCKRSAAKLNMTTGNMIRRASPGSKFLAPVTETMTITPVTTVMSAASLGICNTRVRLRA